VSKYFHFENVMILDVEFGSYLPTISFSDELLKNSFVVGKSNRYPASLKNI